MHPQNPGGRKAVRADRKADDDGKVDRGKTGNTDRTKAVRATPDAHAMLDATQAWVFIPCAHTDGRRE